MDKKYATIQLTADDLAKVKTAQTYLQKELGVKVSLSQTVMYGVDKIRKMAAINKKIAQYEVMDKAYKEAAAYYADPNRKPPTVRDIMKAGKVRKSTK